MFDSNRAVQAVNMDCGRISATDHNRQQLFDGSGDPTDLTRNIASFCEQEVEEEVRTKTFVKDPCCAGVLVSASRQVQLPRGAVRTVKRCHTIAPGAFRKFKDGIVIRWFRSGWLEAAPSQITSQQNTGAPGNRLVAGLQQAAAATAAQHAWCAGPSSSFFVVGWGPAVRPSQ